MYLIKEEEFNKKILPIIEKYTKPLGGRPPKISHYVCFCAMLYMLRVSTPWRDCPKEYGSWHTIYTRFSRWSQNGLLWNILNELKQQKIIGMKISFMDSTTVKLHRHGSGDQKKSGEQSIGKNVAGQGTKIHVIMGRNDPVCVQTTGANTNDAKVAIKMINLLNPNAIERLVADKAYDTNKIRAELDNMNIKAEITNKRNRKISFRFDKALYKWRYRIENFFCRLKENRRLAMRVDKLDTSFIGFIILAFVKLEIC